MTETQSFIRRNFEPRDNLAVVYLPSREGDRPQQHIKLARDIASDVYQAEARRWNERGYNVHLSLNALKPEARNRQHDAVGEIRHVFLDFDDQGERRIRQMTAGGRVSTPSEMILTSRGKNGDTPRYQLLWRVAGFSAAASEQLNRNLAREFGADQQPWERNRTFRLPGFQNRKYSPPQLVTVERTSDRVYGPDQFPQYSPDREPGTAAWTMERLRTFDADSFRRVVQAVQDRTPLRDYVMDHAR